MLKPKHSLGQLGQPSKTPADYVRDKGGDRGAFNTLFLYGFQIPYGGSTTFIEPGVFYPDKSWDQMVAESQSIRNKTAQKFGTCAAFQMRDDDGNVLNAITTGRNADGSASPQWPQSISRSFNIAPLYSYNTLIVATGIAAWANRLNLGRSGGVKLYVFCGNSSEQENTIETDPVYGHRYAVRHHNVSLIGPNGIVSSVVSDEPGPYVDLWDGKNWQGITKDDLFNRLSTGTWPPKNTSLMAGIVATTSRQPVYSTVMRWSDTRQQFDPQILVAGAGGVPAGAPSNTPVSNVQLRMQEILRQQQQAAAQQAAAAAPGAPGAVPGTPDYGKWIGYGGIAVGALILISALRK